MPDIALMTESDTSSASVRDACRIVTLESIKQDEETFLHELLGLCVNHGRIATSFETLVTNAGREAPASLLTTITSYTPLNCPVDLGPAPHQRPVQLVNATIGASKSLVALIDTRAVIARPNVHRGEEFYALYDTKSLAKNLLDNYGKQGRLRLEQAARALTSARVSFVAANG